MQAERVILSRYHSTCHECGQPIGAGDQVLYTPAPFTREVRKQYRAKDGNILLRNVIVGKGAKVRHLDGQCPPVMDYSVQLVYRATSTRVAVRALSAEEAIIAATPKRTSREVDRPCGYVVRQGNVEVLRQVAV